MALRLHTRASRTLAEQQKFVKLKTALNRELFRWKSALAEAEEQLGVDKPLRQDLEAKLREKPFAKLVGKGILAASVATVAVISGVAASGVAFASAPGLFILASAVVGYGAIAAVVTRGYRQIETQQRQISTLVSELKRAEVQADNHDVVQSARFRVHLLLKVLHHRFIGLEIPFDANGSTNGSTISLAEAESYVTKVNELEIDDVIPPQGSLIKATGDGIQRALSPAARWMRQINSSAQGVAAQSIKNIGNRFAPDAPTKSDTPADSASAVVAPPQLTHLGR